jgi:hypothetical protein
MDGHSSDDVISDGRTVVCRQETDFHEDTEYGLTGDGNVYVESTHENGLFAPEEWDALRESPWQVCCSEANRLYLKRGENHCGC